MSNINTEVTAHPNPVPYRKTNSYSQRPSFEQLLTLFLFALHLALHSIFVVAPILVIASPILFVGWALFYLTLLGMCVDYCLITCGDPVDQAIVDEGDLAYCRYRNREMQMRNETDLGREGKERDNPYRTRFCEECRHAVKMSSYHCWRCGRCVEGMDHHCKYLNNCIGARNYVYFFRLLVTTTLYLLLGVGHATWVFVESFSSEEVGRACISRWAVLSLMVYSVVLVLAVDSLLCFHVYISCGRGMTTIQYLFRDSASNSNPSTVTVSAQNLQPDVKP